MLEIETFSTLCRICSKNYDDHLNIYQDKISNCALKISDMLQALKVFELYTDDRLPSTICKGCSENLIICYDFINLWKQTTYKFQEFLKHTNCIVANDKGNVTFLEPTIKKEKVDLKAVEISPSSIEPIQESDEDIKQHFCNQCCRSFRTNKALILHTKITHKALRPITKLKVDFNPDNANHQETSMTIWKEEKNDIFDQEFHVIPIEADSEETMVSLTTGTTITCDSFNQSSCNNNWERSLANESCRRLEPDIDQIKPKNGHLGTISNKIQCSYCPQKFLTDKGLMLHQRITHSLLK